MSQKNIIFIGFGDIASRVSRLLPHCYRVGVARSLKPVPSGVQLWQGAADNSDMLERIAAQRWHAAVVTLTPDEYSDLGYQRAYVDTLRKLLAAWQLLPPKWVLFVSSTSVYGQTDGSWVDENSPTGSSSFSGRRILEAEQLLQTSGIPHCILRCAGIYGPKRNFLERQVRAGNGGSENYTNRIHVEDCAGIIAHLIERSFAGEPLATVYLACDSCPAPGSEVRAWLAEQLGLTQPLRPGAGGRGGNKRCSNARLLATGYTLHYPDYRAGYRVRFGESG